MGSERVEEADEVGLAGRRPWLEIRRRGRDGGPLEHRDAVRLSRAEVADDPRTASRASVHRSRNPMLPDASTRMTRARGAGRIDDANVGSAASSENRTYRSPFGSANWPNDAPAARNRIRRSTVAAGRVSLMY